MGKGHHLEALYSIFGCTHSVKNDLNKLIKKKYETIYNKSTYQELEARSIISAVKKVINSDPWLKGNCNGYSPVNIVAAGNAEYILNLREMSSLSSPCFFSPPHFLLSQRMVVIYL